MRAQFHPLQLGKEITEALVRQGLSTKNARRISRETVSKARKFVKVQQSNRAAVLIEDSFVVDQKIRITIRRGSESKPREVLERYLFNRRAFTQMSYPAVEQFRISDAFRSQGGPADVYIARLEDPQEAKKMRQVTDMLELLSQEEESAILTQLSDKKPK